MKKLIALLLAAVMVLGLAGCGAEKQEIDLNNATWDEIVAAAKGTTVTFYGWGGDENRNNWLNTTVAQHVKEHYGITLEVVGMNIDDILAKLSGEKQAGSRKGSIAMIWFNQDFDNFQTLQCSVKFIQGDFLRVYHPVIEVAIVHRYL